MSQKRFAMVCASNQNRSMEAHNMLKDNKFTVSSYGVGTHVKLPGAKANAPNVYEFGTSYAEIHNDLHSKDVELYTRNGLLKMLNRNMKVKEAPERWQDNRDTFDVVLTFEETVFEKVVEDLQNRDQSTGESVLVINLDVKDNHEQAAEAAPLALKLCQMFEESEDWECEVDDIVDRFQETCGRRPIYSICFY
ncbi:hypothetical protein CYMTET_21235 [Cymbomonas tetramitiformis]|uniref:RNA polymerase II subunit A C-terminal domain phosphatase SSU72 n=1 Tax=Cymbomonas tetramitiformis TaxID=36881 RepID=A0AAE0G2B4_9CHLO|nr:hypothetical protein CYMTET_21235 [Cymbomonas tetramitiformis]|eukprot:gene5720-6907_t